MRRQEHCNIRQSCERRLQHKSDWRSRLCLHETKIFSRFSHCLGSKTNKSWDGASFLASKDCQFAQLHRSPMDFSCNLLFDWRFSGSRDGTGAIKNKHESFFEISAQTVASERKCRKSGNAVRRKKTRTKHEVCCSAIKLPIALDSIKMGSLTNCW